MKSYKKLTHASGTFGIYFVISDNYKYISAMRQYSQVESLGYKRACEIHIQISK